MKVSVFSLYIEKTTHTHKCTCLEKHTYNGLPDLMTKVATSELDKLDPEVKECQVIYVPQVNVHIIVYIPVTIFK